MKKTTCTLLFALVMAFISLPCLAQGEKGGEKGPPNFAKFAVTDTEAVAFFNGKSLSYTYDMGMSLTNTFNGTERTSDIPGRGTVNETVVIIKVSPNIYSVSWKDAVGGTLVQIVNFDSKEVFTTLGGHDDAPVVIHGKIDTFK